MYIIAFGLCSQFVWKCVSIGSTSPCLAHFDLYDLSVEARPGVVGGHIPTNALFPNIV